VDGNSRFGKFNSGLGEVVRLLEKGLGCTLA
jgi:hypothetical protein